MDFTDTKYDIINFKCDNLGDCAEKMDWKHFRELN